MANPVLNKDYTKEIIGAAFNVFNALGYGYKEKEYQRALEEEFKKLGLKYQRELYSNLKYGEKIISKFYVDFLIEGVTVVELKVAEDIYRKHFQQLLVYLKNHNLKVGLIIAFTHDRVLIKRLVN